MLAECWDIVVDGGPTLSQHWIYVPHLLRNKRKVKSQTSKKCGWSNLDSSGQGSADQNTRRGCLQSMALFFRKQVSGKGSRLTMQDLFLTSHVTEKVRLSHRAVARPDLERWIIQMRDNTAGGIRADKEKTSGYPSVRVWERRSPWCNLALYDPGESGAPGSALYLPAHELIWGFITG